MFHQYKDIFQSLKPRYALLSNDSSQENGSYTPRPQDISEKVYRDDCTVAPRKRSFLAPCCIFTIGILFGTALGVLGSIYLKRSRNEDWFQSSAHVKQFAPQMPTRTVIFSENTALMEPPNAANQLVWDALTPIGHGFVNVSYPEVYNLLPGISTDSGVDRYGVAMFHQLHCLGAIRHGYWRLIDGMSASWTNEERRQEVSKQLRDRHSQHCFAYIAESIMCAGDLTIEWAKVGRDGKRTGVNGWGIPHQCKDPEAIRTWMEANHGPAKAGNVHLHD